MTDKEFEIRLGWEAVKYENWRREDMKLDPIRSLNRYMRREPIRFGGGRNTSTPYVRRDTPEWKYKYFAYVNARNDIERAKAKDELIQFWYEEDFKRTPAYKTLLERKEKEKVRAEKIDNLLLKIFVMFIVAAVIAVTVAIVMQN